MNKLFLSLAILSTVAVAGYSRGPAHATRLPADVLEAEARVEAGSKADKALECTLAWERLMDTREEDDYYMIESVKPENRPAFIEALDRYADSLKDVDESLRDYAKVSQDDEAGRDAISRAQVAESARLQLAGLIAEFKPAPASMFDEGNLARVAASQQKVRDMLVDRKNWGNRETIQKERDDKEMREKAAELQKELPELIQKDMDKLSRDLRD